MAVIYERKAETFMVFFSRYPITVKKYIMQQESKLLQGIGGKA